MSGPWIFFVSGRHLRSRRRAKGNAASIMSIGGIASGVMALIAVLGVMNGFQLGTIQDILEINSYHLRVEAGAAPSRTTAAAIGALPQVDVLLPFVDIQTIARGFYAQPRPVVVRAVPDNALALDPGLAESLKIVSGAFDLSFPGSIVVGSELARALGITVGDTVSVLNFTAEGFDIRSPVETPFLVTGVYTTGFLEFDLSWSFVSLQETETVLRTDDEMVWGVKLANRFRDREAAARVGEVLAAAGVDAEIVSWREFNRSIFGALRVEKVLMMLLLGLIFVVVGVNIYQSQKRSILERTEEIGVLKALGASPKAVQSVFVLEGLLIGVVGAVIGTVLGLLVSQNVNEIFALGESVISAGSRLYRWVVASVSQAPQFQLFSPTYFYLEEIPSRVLFAEVLGIFLFAVVSATLAAYVASLRSARIRPAAVFRYE